MSAYDLSIVVPTHGRATLVAELLAAIAQADLDGVRTQILIVDSSPAPERALIATYCETGGATLIDGPVDVREKRNRGIQLAEGDVVFFIDSDCIPAGDVFRRHLECYAEGKDAVLGVTEFRGPETLAWKMVQHTRFLDSFAFAHTLSDKLKSAPWGTCTNLSVRRLILRALGGFDAHLPFRLGGDDVDLGRRINEAGYEIHMAPHAVVYHATETWNRFDKVARRAFRWGRTDFFVTFRKRSEILRLAPAGPAFVTFTLLFGGLIVAVSSGRWEALALAPGWLALYLALFSIIEMRAARLDTAALVEIAGGQTLNLLFEFGTVFEGMLHFDLRPLVLAPQEDPREAIVLWEPAARRFWAVYLSLLVALALVLAT